MEEGYGWSSSIMRPGSPAQAPCPSCNNRPGVTRYRSWNCLWAVCARLVCRCAWWVLLRVLPLVLNRLDWRDQRAGLAHVYLHRAGPGSARLVRAGAGFDITRDSRRQTGCRICVPARSSPLEEVAGPLRQIRTGLTGLERPDTDRTRWCHAQNGISFRAFR